MGSSHFQNVEDFAEEAYASLSKRSRLSISSVNQWNVGGHEYPLARSQPNPLAEPCPLGLKLRKSPSLLELIQMKISQGNGSSISVSHDGISMSECKDSACVVTNTSASDKMKASNFPASLLRIGDWEYVSRYEGDLVAKCYFAKHKLVWEVLEGGLKSKMEIQWSDITALKADCPDNRPGSLTLVLARRPVFFRETNPQPRKHTLWQAASDFTNGQASSNKQHFLQCGPGVLNKHYEKLIQCDMRLSLLSRKPEIVIDTPFFKSQDCENSEESKSNSQNQVVSTGSPASIFDDAASQLSSYTFGSNLLVAQHVSKEAPSPSSDIVIIEGNRIRGSSNVQALNSSVAVSDLMNQIGHRISEQMTFGDLPSTKASQCQEIWDNIARDLLSDSQNAMPLDEKSLMKKVNSLYNLLEDPSTAQIDKGNHNRNGVDNDDKNMFFNLANDSFDAHEFNMMQDSQMNQLMGNFGLRQAPLLPRNDSLGDLLLQLPRIASLPKFSNSLFGIAEDYEYPAP